MNSIDYQRLRSVTARKIISSLVRDGFYLYHQTGAHRRYRHPDGRIDRPPDILPKTEVE